MKKRSSTGLAPVRTGAFLTGTVRAGTSTAGQAGAVGTGRNAPSRYSQVLARGRLSADLGRPLYGSTPATSQRPNAFMTPASANTSSMNYAPAMQSGIKKDARPLQDKPYQRKLAAKIADTLNATGYGEEVTTKDVLKISSQTFVRYFSHFYGILEPGYTLPGRQFDEEVLRITKELNYCGTIQKASLVTIGSPHSLGPVLGIIGWLAEFVAVVELFEPERSEVAQAEYELHMKGYHLWLNNRPLSELKDECYELKLKKLGIGSEEDILQLEAGVKALRKELESMSTKPNQVMKMKQTFEAMREEHDTLEASVQAARTAVEDFDRAFFYQEAIFKDFEIQLTSTIARTRNLKEIIATQSMTPEEARKINGECDALTIEIEDKSKTFLLLQECGEKLQLELGGLHNKLSQIKFNIQKTAVGLGIPLDMESPDTLLQQVKKQHSNMIEKLADNEEFSLQENERFSKIQRRLDQLQSNIKSVNFQHQQRSNNLEALQSEEKQFDKAHEANLKRLESSIGTLTQTLPGGVALDGVRKQLQQLEKTVLVIEKRCREAESEIEKLGRCYQELYDGQMNHFQDLLQEINDRYQHRAKLFKEARDQ